DEVEVEALLSLLEQKLSADETTQRLWKALRRLLSQYRVQLSALRQRVVELEEQAELGRQKSLQKQDALIKEHSQRLSALAETYEGRHALAAKRAENSRSQVDGLLLQLEQAKAEIKRQEEKLSLETERLAEKHSQHLQTLEDENDQLRLQLGTVQAENQPLEAANEDLRRENLELRAKLQTEICTVLGQKAKGDLGRQESQKKDLLALLEHERSLNQDLSSSMGHQRQQIVILEDRLQAALIELKHKDQLLEAVRTEVFHKASVALGPSGQQDLLRLVSLFQGGSSEKSPKADGSTKADSGIQGMSSAGRSRSDMSARTSQTSPKRVRSLEGQLTDLHLRQRDTEMEVLRAKRNLRNTTDELIKLTKLGGERAAQLKELRWRMRTPPASLSTPGGYDYRSESANPQEVRTASIGFVPSSARQFSRTIRKVGRRRPVHLSSTPEESLNSLADVSSIRNTAEPENRRGRSPSEEHSHVSDNVFEPDIPERATEEATPCRQFSIGVQQGSARRGPDSRNVGIRGTISDDRKSRRDPKYSNKVSDEGLGLKTISRSPWLRGDGGGTTHGGVWSYVPPAQDSTRPPTVGTLNQGQEGRGARRSLSFPEEPNWANTPAAPFVFCTAAPLANGGSLPGSQEIGFQTQSLPTPVYLNVHVHSHHAPREV
ncbi:unnamed protein product, partial [Ixodes hexagonus]